MAAEFQLIPTTERGRELLDELERRTRLGAIETYEDGSRTYWLRDKDADVHSFDATLDELDPDWRDHITPPE